MYFLVTLLYALFFLLFYRVVHLHYFLFFPLLCSPRLFLLVFRFLYPLIYSISAVCLLFFFCKFDTCSGYPHNLVLASLVRCLILQKRNVPITTRLEFDITDIFIVGFVVPLLWLLFYFPNSN